MKIQYLVKAIQIAGNQSQLARKVNKHVPKKMHIKQQNVWFWLNESKKVPAEYAIPVEKAVDGGVTRYQLRSDIYPLED